MNAQEKMGFQANSFLERNVVVSFFPGKFQANVAKVSDEKEISFEKLQNQILKRTYSLMQFKDGYRNKENFKRASCIALDIDKNLTIPEAIARLKNKKLLSIVATTRNHQKVKNGNTGGKLIPACDRFRIIFGLTKDVGNPNDFESTMSALREIFPESDNNAKDCARYFFPSSEIVFTQFDGIPFDPVIGERGVSIERKLKSTKKKDCIEDTERTPVIMPGINLEAAYSRAMKFLNGWDTAVEGDGGDSHTLQTAQRLFDLGIQSPEQCCELMEESGWNDRCDPPWGHRDLLEKCRNAWRYRKDAIGSKAPEVIFGGEQIDWEKPTITIKRNMLHDLVADAEKALVDSKIGLYSRGPNLVEPVIEQVDASDGRKTTITRLKEATPALIRLRLSRVANWLKWDGREKKDVPADPPKDIAESILLRDGEWSFPVLAGVITCPTLRPDGSLLITPGYDPIRVTTLIHSEKKS